MSKMTSPETIGISSAVITFATIVSVVTGLGIPTGIQRFLGKSYANSMIQETRLYLRSALILTTFSILLTLIIFFLFREGLTDLFELNTDYLLIALLLMASIVYSTLFRGIVISSLNTKILSIVVTISATLKILLGVVFILSDFGALGLILSFTINQTIISIALSINALMLLYKNREGFSISDFKASFVKLIHSAKQVLYSSIVYWIPAVITTIGSQIGTIFIYGTTGAEDAGLFFIALTIVTGLTSVMYSLFTISLPYMSSMDSNRGKFISNIIRLSLIIAIPFSSSLIVFSSEVLSLLGPEYSQSSTILNILLFSMIPTAIQFGMISISYSYGKNSDVLILGLTTSIPRVVIYLMLIPFFGGFGAAIGYTIGSLIGMICSFKIANKYHTDLQKTNVLIIFCIPMFISLLLKIIDLYFIYAIFLNLVLCYLIYYVIKIMKNEDIGHISKFVPRSLIRPMGRLLKKYKDGR